MFKELVIDLSTSGRAQALHMDDFSLSFLGEMSITRASEIVFNKGTQTWSISIPNKSGVFIEVLFKFSGYAVARGFEVSWLQACRKKGCSPLSVFGGIEAKKLAFELLSPQGKRKE